MRGAMETFEPVARDARFLEELVERALALPVGDTAALLRVANSAASYSATRIADLPTAITRLGYRRVAALALGAPGLRMLQRPPDGLEGARWELHRHAIRVGLSARALAPAGVDPERALA